MIHFINKNYFLKGILIALCSVSFAWAAPTQKTNDLKTNTKVGIEFGLGPPVVWARNSRRKTKQPEQATLNMMLGIVLGYCFPLDDDSKWGPEIGLIYGFTRRAQIPSLNYTQQEKYLQIPLTLKYGGNKSSIGIGYEFDVLLASAYEQGGVELKEKYPDYANLKKSFGSILLTSTLSFSKSIYLATKLKIPTALFLTKAENDAEGRVYELRGLSASCGEISLGVDIMRPLQNGVFYPSYSV